MHASASLFVLFTLSTFSSAAPNVRPRDLSVQNCQSQIVTETVVKQVTVTITADGLPHSGHDRATGGSKEHAHHKTTLDDGSISVAPSAAAGPISGSIHVPLAPGSGGEKGYGPFPIGSGTAPFPTGSAPYATGSGSIRSGSGIASSGTRPAPIASGSSGPFQSGDSSSIFGSASSSATIVVSTPASSLLTAQSEVTGSPSSATASSASNVPTTTPVISNAESTAASTPSSAPPSATPTSTSASLSQTSSSSSTAASTTPSSSGKYPFTALVAFGDNLSDNGNGSVAHHVADASNPNNKIYGAGTWTNGPVAVSYLTDLLSVPLTQDFAFGHAWGGSDFGATIDDTIAHSNFSKTDTPYFSSGEFTSPSWGAPSAKLQIADYIASGVDRSALHFLWIGNNDINIATVNTGNPSVSSTFAVAVSTKIAALVSTLLDAGAPYVFVANLYPKHLAPITPAYFGMTTPTAWDAFGLAINAANTALASQLEQFGDKVIYYDAFTYMSNLYANPGSLFPNEKDTNGYPAFCDGDPNKTAEVEAAIAAGTISKSDENNWGICVDEGKQDEWYWMQYLDMTSHVHELVAGDMERVVAAHFA